MKSEDIRKVYFNKEITDRPLDEYDDRIGRFCIIEMKNTEHQEGRKKKSVTC
ncbi:MAG: hypothetical protein GY801_22940 [bacterium]|nr:hypothetical protein [bacterium]